MTNTEHYLEVAKECGAEVWNSYELPIHMTKQTLDSYTARICAEKDAEIADYQSDIDTLAQHNIELQQQLSTANAAIAIKDEALKDLLFAYENYSDIHNESVAKANSALSTSTESIAAWEAEKLLPLQRQVAINKQVHELVLIVLDTIKKQRYPELQFILAQAIAHTKSSVDLSQATAEAYERELSAKVLEGAEKRMMNLYDEKVLREMAADLRNKQE